MIIDAHHHLWKYDPVEYGWIGPEMETIRRSFLPGDLTEVLQANGVDGAIAVQARESIEETEWLLDLASGHEAMLGVVGWVPLVDERVESVLERFAANRKLLGVRHVLQGEEDDQYMLRQDFNRGIRLLRSFRLVYDILIYERHLPQTIEFVDRHPGQVFVLDHIAKPRIRDGEIDPWRERLAELAKRPNVYCKFSGLVTEADWTSWNAEPLRPYWDSVVESFGPNRMMFGSDWPVLLVASPYARWLEAVHAFVSELSSSEQNRIWSGTAREAYGLQTEAD